MSERDETQKRIRRSAWLLALLALAVYAGYYVIHLSRSVG